MRKKKISVYVIAYNEEEKIRDCLETVTWADEVLVIDSNSTDNTAKIAESLGARVVQVEFEGFGDLRNKAIANCTGDWILSIDSDERCTKNVQHEILEIVNSPQFDIYKIPRKNFFMGKWIRYSGWYPNFRQPQLFMKGAMEYDLKPVHEGYIQKSSRGIGVLKNSIWQIPFKDTEEVIHKANRYSSLGVSKLLERNANSNVTIAFFHGLWSFIKHYFFKLGFLDGGPGFVIAFGNFEGTFYRYIKLYEHNKKNYWKIPNKLPDRK